MFLNKIFKSKIISFNGELKLKDSILEFKNVSRVTRKPQTLEISTYNPKAKTFQCNSFDLKEVISFSMKVNNAD